MADPRPAAAVAPAGRDEGTLTRRASLTFASTMLQQGARFFTAFVVTPIIIRGLGAELYGAWVMIQQTIGYLAISDLRPMGALKFTLAVQQHHADVSEKRRQIGAALLLWAATLPLVVAVGAGLVWAAPRIVQTAPELQRAVQLAMAITAVGVALDKIVSLPANVLRGLNLDYKAMGSNAAVVLLGGVISAAAIYAGWGLPGVASAGLAGLVLGGAARYWVVRRAVPWFGADRPSRSELRVFQHRSWWLFVGALGSILLVSSDLLLVGIVLGPTAAALYSTTGAALRLVGEPLIQLLSSGTAGVAGLCGRADWARVRHVRREMHLVGVGAMTVLGVGVLLLNGPFVRLWLGEGLYAGALTTALLLLITYQSLLFRIDSIVVDHLAVFREKAWAVVASGGAGLALGGLLARDFGLPGMALGTLVGRAGLMVYLPRLIASRTGHAAAGVAGALVRPVLAGACIVGATALIAPWLEVRSWAGVAVTGLVASAASASLWFALGLDAAARRTLGTRLGVFLPARARRAVDPTSPAAADPRQAGDYLPPGQPLPPAGAPVHDGPAPSGPPIPTPARDNQR